MPDCEAEVLRDLDETDRVNLMRLGLRIYQKSMSAWSQKARTCMLRQSRRDRTGWHRHEEVDGAAMVCPWTPDVHMQGHYDDIGTQTHLQVKL
jgi:hypothetical protein